MQKTAIVTGCSKGIGLSIAKTLASDGYRVFALSRNYEAMHSELNQFDNILLHKIDLYNLSEVSDFVSNIDCEIDILIHNAGGGVGNGLISDDKPENWINAYRINVVAPMFLTQSILPKMKAGSNIFVVTSLAGYTPYIGGAGYSAAKRAETSLADSMRKELSSHRIKVTEIIPGSVNTDERIKPSAIESDDIANAISWVSSLPEYLNIDSLVLTHINNIKP